jgi:hypothetical protein
MHPHLEGRRREVGHHGGGVMEDELEREQQWRYIRPRWLGSKWWFGIQVVVWGIQVVVRDPSGGLGGVQVQRGKDASQHVYTHG